MINSNIEHLYRDKRYLQILEHAKRQHRDIVNDKDVLFLGFTYLELQMPKDALECLLSVKLDDFNDYEAKAYRYIALSYYLLGEYQCASHYMDVSIHLNDLEALLWKKLLFPKCAEVHEIGKMIFWFVEPISPLASKLFMSRSLYAYKSLVDFTGEELYLKKINIYIYQQRVDVLGNPLSYADNGMKTIHINVNDFAGHELAHILFNSLYYDMHRCAFVDEGIATFFSYSLSFAEYIRRHKHKLDKYDILEYWCDSSMDKRLANDQYLFAGAFVGYLLEKYGKYKLLSFIKDERASNAEKVFGESPERIVEEFYEVVEKMQNYEGA